MQSVKDYTLFTALRQCVGRLPVVKTTSGYMAVLFIYIDRMLFMAPTLDNADPLFALVITPGFYLHHVEVADKDPASGSLYAGNTGIYKGFTIATDCYELHHGKIWAFLYHCHGASRNNP